MRRLVGAELFVLCFDLAEEILRHPGTSGHSNFSRFASGHLAVVHG